MYNKADKTINFTTLAVDADLLQEVKIKDSIKNLLGLDDAQYATLVSKGIKGMEFAVFASGTRVSVNGESYDEGELLEDTVYSTGVVGSGVRTIQLETAVTGQFKYNIDINVAKAVLR